MENKISNTDETANGIKQYVVGSKSASEMEIADIEKELDEVTKWMEQSTRHITFTNHGRAEELLDELKYRKYYEPRGISRFQAGQAMFYGG